MISQTLKGTAKTVSLTIENVDDNEVTVDAYDRTNTSLITDRLVTSTTDNYETQIGSDLVDAYYTIRIEWSYTVGGDNKMQASMLDVVDNDTPRYCYQVEVRDKLYDITLPTNFNMSKYTRRASIEIQRALQGLYVIPFNFDTDSEYYEQDKLTLQELASDVAAGYVIEDIGISRIKTRDAFNHKKAAAFAELNRYANRDKVFVSLEKDTTKQEVTYDLASPKVANAGDTDAGDSDPLSSLYNRFSPSDEN